MTTTQAQPESDHLSGKMAVAASLLVVVTAVVMGLAGTVAVGWVAGIGAALVVVGVLGGHRVAAGAGVLSLATASLVLTYDAPLIETLFVNAAVALVCVVELMAIDLSFSARRDTRVSGVTLTGFVWAHAIAAGIGIGAAVLALAVVLSVDWPGWLLLLPAVLLTAGALGLLKLALDHQKSNQKPTSTAGQATPSIGNQTWARR